MKKHILNILVFLIYAFITLFAVLNHEIWADEAQVWQLCKHLSIMELLQHLHNEGHPPLIYLLIMPFAKLTNNIIFMQILCWLSMVLASFLLLFFSPFKNYTKYAILLSAGFIYFLPVIARSYALIPFLVLMAAFLYKKQKEHPILYCSIIAILANLHIIMFCFSFLLLVDFILKNKKELSKKVLYLSSLIPIISLFVVVSQLWDTTSNNSYITFSFEHLFFKIQNVLSLFFLNACNYVSVSQKDDIFTLFDISLILISVAIYILCFINIALNDKKLFLITFLSISFQLAIYIFTYSENIYPTRIFSAHIIMIFTMWILLNKDKTNEKYSICSKKSINFLLTIFFIFTSYNGINYLIKEIKYDYSGAKSAAEFLMNNTEDDAIILTSLEPFSIGIVYYLEKNGKNIISAVRRTLLKYVIWDEKSIIVMAPSSWIDAAKYYSSLYQTQKIYIIKSILENNAGNTDLNSEFFDLIYESQKTTEGNEEYKIYKLK